MKETEAQVFIVWSKGLEHRDKIIADIGTKFEIIECIDTTWSKEKFPENLSRFYGENLPKNSFKEKHCGTDTFLCVLVRDNNPVYELRETSKGVKSVNANMFDAKTLYREWTGGGHKIHGSDNVAEAKSNIYLLYGTPYDDVVESDKSNASRTHDGDLVGANGWCSLEEVFDVFNELGNYVVLRNYRNLEDELDNLHPDIDVLSDDQRLLIDVSNGKPTFKDSKRVQYLVNINNQNVFFDFRFVGDNYYDSKWEQEILRSKTTYKNMNVPDGVNHFYSLMYHAFIHKETIGKDYILTLIELSKDLKLNYDNKSILDYKILDDLNEFMNKNNYSYTEPRDLTVFFNTRMIEKYDSKLISSERQFHEKIKFLKRLVMKVIRKFKPDFRLR